MKQKRRQMNTSINIEMLKIGHRGACGYAPENTLASFSRAIDLKVDMVEFDVQLSRDGEVVVIHDFSVDRTTDGRGLVKDFSLKELKLCSVSGGEKIPTLSEVLNLINRRVKVNIELKCCDCVKPVADIIKQYITEKNWSVEDFIVSSFNWNELEKFRQINSEIRIGILAKRRIKGFLKYRLENILDIAGKLNAYVINMELSAVSIKKIHLMRKSGFKVFVYTVNNLKDIEKMKKIGVDGIFSNYPDRI